MFDRIVSKEAYAEVDARRVIRTLLQVTEHLHGMSIVHRDYKPEVMKCVQLGAAHSPGAEPSAQVPIQRL